MKVLLSRQGGLFICGTNAFNPLCANYTVSTAYLKHTCTKMYCFGTSPHPLCFHYPKVLSMFLGSVFSHYIFFILFLFSAAHYISHTFFFISFSLTAFFASKLHSAFQSTACSIVPNDWLHWVAMHFWPGWESLHNPQAKKESPLPFVYTLFFHLPDRQYAQKQQAVFDDLKSRELSLISLDVVFCAWLW